MNSPDPRAKIHLQAATAPADHFLAATAPADHFAAATAPAGSEEMKKNGLKTCIKRVKLG